MGYLDGLGANTFRMDSKGRLVIVPFRRRGKAYIVPRSEAERLGRFQRWWFASMMVAVLGSVFAFGPVIMVTIVAPLWVGGLYARLWQLTRGLEEASEVPPLSREEALARTAKRMGLKTIAMVCVISALLAGVGVYALVGGVHAVAVWAPTGYFAFVAALYAFRWWQFGRRGVNSRDDG
jgi:hypothetical protein